MDPSPQQDNYLIEIANRQTLLQISEAELVNAVSLVLQQEGIKACEIDLALVDNQAIHRVNEQFLNHDYPTDVVTFPLSDSRDPLEGEIVISVEYAAAEANQYQWPVEHEVLLYAVHGTLHLLGYDDQDRNSKAVMRQLEKKYLNLIKIDPPYAKSDQKLLQQDKEPLL